MKNFIKILDLKITSDSKQEILERIEKYVKNRKTKTQNSKIIRQKPLIIFTPNREIVVYAQKNAFIKEIINKAQINIPDGMGLVWSAHTLGYNLKERIAGADLFKDIVSMTSKQHVTIGLIGGYGKIALKTLECLNKQFKALQGWAESGPKIRIQNSESRIQNNYGNWDINKFVERVKERNTKLLFVAFGCPKQEVFINEIAKKLDNIVIMAVGGTFDYYSGRLKRAPQFIQSLGFEWLYRLIQEPQRFRRQLSLLEFEYLIFKKRLCLNL